MRGAASIKVNKPIEEVWEFISDISNSDQWLAGVSEPVLATEGEIARGSTFNCKYRFDNKSHDVSYVLTSFDPPKKFSYRMSGGPHPAYNFVELKSEKGLTKINHVMEMDISQLSIGVVFLGLGPFVRLSIMMKLRKDLKRLKALLEAA